MSTAAMGNGRECPRRGLQSSYWLKNPLIGQQLIQVLLPSHWSTATLSELPPSYWLKCQTPSHWSTAHPSPPTLLLHNTHSDWSTAYPRLMTLLLAYMLYTL